MRVFPRTLTLAVLLVAGVAGTLRARLLGEGGREDGGGQVELLTEVLNTGVSQEVVEPLPVELEGHKVAGSQGLHDHHDVQVRHIDALVLLLQSVWQKCVL